MTEDLAQHLQATARAIAGDEVPSVWLCGAVRQMADELAYAINADARVPKRADLRRQITAARDASQLLDVLLFPFMNEGWGSASLLLSDHLLRDGEPRIEYEAPLHRMLEDIVERCREALERVPDGAGQGRTLSNIVEENTGSAQTKCATAVQILWKQVNGRLPGLRNVETHRACSELWLASGGKGSKMSGWVSDLTEARRDRHRRESDVLARMLGVQGIHAEKP